MNMQEAEQKAMELNKRLADLQLEKYMLDTEILLKLIELLGHVEIVNDYKAKKQDIEQEIRKVFNELQDLTVKVSKQQITQLINTARPKVK